MASTSLDIDEMGPRFRTVESSAQRTNGARVRRRGGLGYIYAEAGLEIGGQFR